MPRLIRVFAGRTVILLVFVMRRLKCMLISVHFISRKKLQTSDIIWNHMHYFQSVLFYFILFVYSFTVFCKCLFVTPFTLLFFPMRIPNCLQHYTKDWSRIQSINVNLGQIYRSQQIEINILLEISKELDINRNKTKNFRSLNRHISWYDDMFSIKLIDYWIVKLLIFQPYD